MTYLNLIDASVPGAVLQSNLVDDLQVWTIPCDTDVFLSFQFDQSFPQGNFVMNGTDGTCTGVVQAWSDASIEYFLLGSNFISANYL